MPKELTHLIITDEAMKRVEALSPERGRILRENYALFMSGSIICDTAFYDISLFKREKSIDFLSHGIHTHRGALDENFFRRLIGSDSGKMGEKDFAFACGILSHHMADKNFHPFVGYFTGNYMDEDPARKRRAEAAHRFLEGLIDLQLKERVSASIDPSYARKLLKGNASLLPSLKSFVKAAKGKAGQGEEELSKRLFSLFNFQLRLLGLYEKKWFKWTVLLINRLFKFKFSNYAALLYPDRSYLDLPLFTGPLSFIDPFSGGSAETSVLEIAEKSIKELTEAILAYQNVLPSEACRDGEYEMNEAHFSSFFRPTPAGGGVDKRFFASDVVIIEEALDKFLGREKR